VHIVTRGALSTAVLVAALAAPAVGQEPTGIVGDLLKDIVEVEGKLMGLAREIPPDKYGWRPGEGVRSVGEVFMHIAADNYLLSAAIGKGAPASTGITHEDYNTAMAYEQRKLSRDAIINELQASLTHFKAAVSGTPVSKLASSTRVFGGDYTVQQLLIIATTHLHEHLGQMIAYARSNGIAPPWSRSGQ
jgi:uncharacterized damage-inducible protein DinB